MRPPAGVVDAFAASGDVTALPGGQGTSFRVGEVVLKPAGLPAEAEWIGAKLETLSGPGFRLPRPVRSANGGFVTDGWTAWTFVEGEPAGRNGGRWSETLAACDAFHRALAGIGRPAFLDKREDPWSLADRMAFGEAPLQCSAAVRELLSPLLPLLAPVALPSQVIHGDFTANVLFAPGLTPAVIDFSPYWRPALFATAVVAVDALSWAGVAEREAARFSDEPDFGQMFARAAMRRLLEFDQHLRAGRARGGELGGFARAVGAATRLLAG